MTLFISYSRQDKDCVYRVVEAMKNRDFDCWVDTERIEFGAAWMELIEQQIQHADVFLLFWSQNASESRYVTEERRIARDRNMRGEIVMSAVMLDDTPLPSGFEHLQAGDLRGSCSAVEVNNYVSGVPESWKSFSFEKPLEVQPHQQVAGTPLLRVHYRTKGDFSAGIVGPPDGRLADGVKSLAVCLQMFQPLNKNMLVDVHRTLGISQPWMLHITGPESKTQPGQYGLDNNDPDQWELGRQFVNRVVSEISVAGPPVLKFFTLAPAAMVGGIATAYGRFWHVQFYNWVGNTEPPYALVLDLPLNRTV